ncbi:leukotriene A-4 hydrolase [Eremomyces bilateralis CBS 781.70]|uniref:Leukotriene A(4) hydrolase n=1 Tax=Eremomyces bilateralis CBS 781.70 TaxID=1392243 RepID=A0A6G1G5U1_9PEZI|nr:leukotriene A-4 hydrolase [Eremomyces bilateralis CBS 781.70]KAF1813311.1 leukotriene A-4 hydrolase [Eremomyces bilateralis CBS 781.70]
MARIGSAVRDPNTLSNYDEFVTRHITANLEVDFEGRRLSGDVVLRMRSVTGEGDRVVLDTSYVDIKGISIGGKKASWDIAPRVEPYGRPLAILLGDAVQKDQEFEVSISLSTTPECSALQWLGPEQTSNGQHPYMFSQCQAIHCRSIFPCQDTPDVKATVDINIRSPLPVVAGGLPTGTRDFQPGKDGKRGTLLYTFEQKLPIPSYLFALASGDLATAAIGPRSSVVTGPEELQGCKWELEEDMEKFMEAAEGIVYPYAWTTYNVLVLPPSFPYGGMENPIFTFATPTIISKDRQNIDVIAHELAHSWSGNLVSTCSWEHFWLNEGWTVYLERRILAAVHGEAHRDFSAIIGWKALEDSVKLYGADHEYTKMVPNLKEVDPDDAFSSIPYEKGFNFLYHLEKLIGKGKWDRFIPHYFTVWKARSLDSFEFKQTLLDFFAADADASQKLHDLDWDTWLFGPGLPPKPDFDETLAKECYALADKWERRTTGADASFAPQPSDIAHFSANQTVVFLERLQTSTTPFRPADMELMGATYRLSESANVELVSRFYSLALKSRAEAFYAPAAELLGTVGRMKFVRPLYRALNGCDRQLAIATFERNRGFYHPICRGMVEKDLFGGQG